MLKKTDELKDRVEATRLRLQTRLAELKADTRMEAIATKKAIKSAMEEIEKTLVDGWDKATDAVSAQAREWLARNDDKGDDKTKE